MDARARSGVEVEAVPRAGIAGLRHWRHDLVAGLQVALLWTPFSLGVAIASGAPAVAGLLSAIVAGLLMPWLGGSHVAVSGPAAALAPVLLWGMLQLGHGDLAAGYPLVLVAVVLTGALQLLLSALRAGQYATLLPATVVEAMLAAIGLMIILRQLPALVGAPSAPAHSALQALQRLPQQFGQAQLAVAALGAVSLAGMFVLRRRNSGAWRWLPAPIVVAALGAAAAWLLGLGPELRIRMPASVTDALHAPAFGALLADSAIWASMAIVVITFTLIDGVESVASVKAVDKIDPWRRKSDANRTLRAMGVCNIASGSIGGLTVIPNAVPSRANIDAGARTLWSNLFSALFLLLFVLALPGLLARIPLAAIAAVLCYIGWRLCEPALWLRMLAIGRDRFVVFTVTVVAVLCTDLLLGMAVGVAVELALLLYLLMPSLRYVLTGRLRGSAALSLLQRNLRGLVGDPVIRERVERIDDRDLHVLTMGSLVGFNLLALEKRIARLPPADGLQLRFTESARIIDHTAAEFLQQQEEEFAAAGRPFAIDGTVHFQPFSAHPMAARMQEPHIAREQEQRDGRAQQMTALAARHGLGFDGATRAMINRHGFVYLKRGDQREQSHRLHGPLAGGELQLFDYAHTSPPDYHAPHRHTLLVLQLAQPTATADFVLTPGLYLERYLVQLRELQAPFVPPGYRLYTVDGSTLDALPAALLAALQGLGPLYVEQRGGALLAFGPQRGLEDEAGIEALLELGRAMALQPCPAPASAG